MIIMKQLNNARLNWEANPAPAGLEASTLTTISVDHSIQDESRLVYSRKILTGTK